MHFFLLRTGPWTAISPAGIHLEYTVASKDETNCILWKLKTVFVCPRQRWTVTVILLGSIVRNRWHNLQMYSFQFSTLAIMQMCSFIRLSVVLSSVSYILQEEDVIFMPVSANSFVEFIVGFFFFWVECSIFSLSNRPWKFCHSVIQMF